MVMPKAWLSTDVGCLMHQLQHLYVLGEEHLRWTRRGHLDEQCPNPYFREQPSLSGHSSGPF